MDVVCFFVHLHVTFFISFFFGKATKSDRIYVNAPDMPKEKNGDIQLLSFNSHNAGGPETGEENRGLDIQEKEDEPDRKEEFLTPGDLMAFAWQISQGMVSCLGCLDGMLLEPQVGQRVSFIQHIALLYLPTKIRFPIGGKRVTCRGSNFLGKQPNMSFRLARDQVALPETEANLCEPAGIKLTISTYGGTPL